MSDTDYIESAIESHLVSDTDIQAMVSGRVYPGKIKEKEPMPAIMYRQISGPRDKTHNETGAFLRARFEFNCYGKDFTEAATLTRLVRKLFNNFRGTMGVAPNTYDVDGVEVDGPDDGWDDDVERHRRQLDMVFMYRED